MDVAARLSSKNRVTVPKAVREALGLAKGDRVVFLIEGKRAILIRSPNFLELAGTVEVPGTTRSLAWSEIRQRALEEHVAKLA
jgi:AbrB family looped-hinge helix DNA binding protein